MFFPSLKCNNKGQEKGDGVVLTLHIFIREIFVSNTNCKPDDLVAFCSPPPPQENPWREP